MKDEIKSEVENKFCFANYLKILKKYRSMICDFKQVTDIQKFVLLRHDVEFSVERALELAKLDQREGIQSSFLFQVRSNAYNVFSTKNSHKINEIYDLGHYVG